MKINVCVGFDVEKRKEVFRKVNVTAKQIKEILEGMVAMFTYKQAEAWADKIEKEQ